MLEALTFNRLEMRRTWLDRALSPFADVRAGEGATVLLMLVNVFLLLMCYSVIKTVREPLILLGGGAEVRSYAAAGQALVLMAFVPIYSWFASRVNRVRLLVGVTLFFVACIELFSLAVAARVPYVGVAFFIWVGLFNMSLVATFWSLANDLYSKEAGARLFPLIMIGMTAGAPLGSLAAGSLFRTGIAPQVILQLSAALLMVSVGLYIAINRRAASTTRTTDEALAGPNGFSLVLGNRYLQLLALLVVLLNVVNTTGEYLMARLLTAHVADLAATTVNFNKQAFIGAYFGQYQFWVNVGALLLQAFVTSRLVKYRGLSAALMVLPLIALGGYAMIAAGAGFGIVRWIKTAENATDYSIMNTARQMLWLPTSREEKYKAKQAVDTFFVRIGDVLSAVMVYLGTQVFSFGVSGFAAVNVALVMLWIIVALRILGVQGRFSFGPRPRMAAAAAAVVLVVLWPGAASAQTTREETRIAAQAEKATRLHPIEPDTFEKRMRRVEQLMSSEKTFYPFIGTVFQGGLLAMGPGMRTRFGDTGVVNAHAAWSLRNYKTVDGAVDLPEFLHGRAKVNLHANWLDAPAISFFGLGNETTRDDKSSFAYEATTAGASLELEAARHLTVGVGADSFRVKSDGIAPGYLKSSAFVAYDWRTAERYATGGGLYRVDVTDYNETTGGNASFRRVDAEAQQFIPFLQENWIIALRALASTTDTTGGNEVPFFLTPDLGGNRMLRGYSAWRFRDNNRLLLTGEYRWTAGQFVDMALFVDAGKVAPEFASLDLKGLQTSYGIGLSFHTVATTIMRVEVARTKEGTGLLFSFGPSF